MSSRTRLPSCLVKLKEDNPQVEIIDGTRHWQISADGIFVGIYPRTPRTEGFAGNTKSQLRRAGLVVEGR